MSFISQNYSQQGDDHCFHFSIHEDDNADQHEEHQSTCSELPAEIPDSQPDPYLPYLPAEIPDSQPDPYRPYLPAEIPDSQPDSGYRDDLDYSEVSSQLPDRDLHLVDAEAFDLGDYDLREEDFLSPSDFNLVNRENIDPRSSRFDGFGRDLVDGRDYDEAVSRASTCETEIIPGGTRLTSRLKDRIVS